MESQPRLQKKGDLEISISAANIDSAAAKKESNSKHPQWIAIHHTISESGSYFLDRGGYISQLSPSSPSSKPNLSVITPENSYVLSDLLQVRTSPMHQDRSATPDMNETQMVILIDHDPLRVQSTKEYGHIQHYNSLAERHGLTLPVFRSALSVQPRILHFTFHGDVDEDSGQFTVEFDGTSTLTLLLAANYRFKKKKRDSQWSYVRHYFAAIAIFIEEEVASLLATHLEAEDTDDVPALWRVIDANCKFFEREQMRDFVKSIVSHRFGCSCLFDDAQKRILIGYGTVQYDADTKSWSSTKEVPLPSLFPLYLSIYSLYSLEWRASC